MSQCDIEEADLRMSAYLLDALQKWARTMVISTEDTDVLVILCGQFFNLKTSFPQIELWVAFGTGKHYKEYHINSICETLGAVKSMALPYFHAYSGCDSTSQFNGKGKRSAWEAWKSFPEVTEAFISIAAPPFELLEIDSLTFKLLERYTCVLYSKTAHEDCVNELRKGLFSQKSQTMENIPPSKVSSLL